MSQTLLTAASGLLAHQRKLDVVANNLANINTNSYKAQKVLFADLLYNTFQPAQGSEDPTEGGSNPKQIGFGVDVAQITRNFAQGVLSNTGEQFDFAIQGEGYFVVEGDVPQFTRDGAFSLDRNGFLVDPSTGGLVQRFGTIGEGTVTDPGFQTSGDSKIYVPLGASVAGKETTDSSILGNLPAGAVPPLEEVMTTASPFLNVGVPADLTTLLNDLDSNLVDYQAGDTIDIVGTNVDGSSFTTSIPAGPGTMLGDIVNAVNANVVGATMNVSAEGNLVLTADATGEALLSLNLSDGGTNVGGTDFLKSPLIVQTEGKEGDQFESTIQVFDVRGEPHAIQVTFEKMSANNWDARFSSGEAGVTFVDDLIENITFEEDGAFRVVNGTGLGDINVEMQIAGLNNPQAITLSMEDLTHRATSFSSAFDQNGFPPGEIISVGVAGGGILEGVASNGRRISIAQLALATFNNVRGLEAEGGNYYVESSNSGVARIGAAQSNGSGAILSGQLETSNVDVALEFTQLIVAQRGFSANARSITVATEVLEELTNIIR